MQLCSLCTMTFRLSKTINNKTGSFLYIPKRYKFKKKWAVHRKSKEPEQLALEHFDIYYKPVFGPLWPSIRLALLSQRKYAALVNNFVPEEKTDLNLTLTGATDLLDSIKSQQTGVEDILDRMAPKETGVGDMQDNNIKDDLSEVNDIVNYEQSTQNELNNAETMVDLHEKDNNIMGSNSFLDVDTQSHETEEVQSELSHGMYDFMPVKKILSEKALQRELEVQQNIYTLPNEELVNDVVSDDPVIIPSHLRLFTHDMGEVELFDQPNKGPTKLLDYYIMDGSSILPVLALGIQPDSQVLHLYADQGTKILSILQTLLPDHVTCIDKSFFTRKELKSLLYNYLPSDHIKDRVTFITADIVTSTHQDKLYDMVLVDAPSFMDRHVLNYDEINLFRGGRITDRLEIQDRQLNLLLAGIKMCKEGGSIVYTTSTLSPPQNDGLIYRAVEKLQEEGIIEVDIVDTSQYRDLFSHCFHFYEHCKFGELVIPKVTANFGPTYFCKLRRL